MQYLSANTTAQFSDSVRGRFAYNNSWAKTTGILPALAGTEPTGTNYGLTTTFPNYTLSGNVDWVASPKLFFGVRGGYYYSDINDTNVTEQPRYVFQTGNNLAIPGVPDRRCGSQPGSRRSRLPPSSSRRAISRRVPTSRPTERSTAASAGSTR